jgi:hypothetical protein
MPRSSSFSEAPLRALAVCREQSLAKAALDTIRRGRLVGNRPGDRLKSRARQVRWSVLFRLISPARTVPN